jgi:hypothetical protein
MNAHIQKWRRRGTAKPYAYGETTTVALWRLILSENISIKLCTKMNKGHNEGEEQEN